MRRSYADTTVRSNVTTCLLALLLRRVQLSYRGGCCSRGCEVVASGQVDADASSGFVEVCCRTSAVCGYRQNLDDRTFTLLTVGNGAGVATANGGDAHWRVVLQRRRLRARLAECKLGLLVLGHNCGWMRVCSFDGVFVVVEGDVQKTGYIRWSTSERLRELQLWRERVFSCFA